MLKLIFELLTDPLGLPINDAWEHLILLIIGAISFSVGWEASPGGRFGSVIHWCVRLIVFFVLWAITYGVISAFKWFVENWMLCLAGLLGIGFLVLTLFLIKKRLKHSYGD